MSALASVNDPVLLLLSVFGLLCLCSEMYLPGIIFGLLGAGCVCAGACGVLLRHGPWAALALVVADGALFAVFFRLSVRLLRGSRLGRQVFLTSHTPGSAVEEKLFESLVGRKTTVVSVCRPTGIVELDGRRYQARSLEGVIDRDTPVEVTGFESNTLIVRSLATQPSTTQGG